ncbi:MAG: ferritin family protein [Proteobacteria bacterium]|nr:ferritin family protein [Pseudomonadota bacterium]MBU4037966.1 ferritin family protein [Pseudomonadota bacterium]
MKIFELAKQVEKNGEKFYTDLADKTTDVGLKKIFTLLAQDEKKHYIIFESMEQQRDFELTDTNVLKEAKAIFQNIRDRAVQISNGTPQEEVYLVAYANEQNSIEIYSELLDNTRNDNHREVIGKIIEEENKHKFLIEQLIEFIRRPEFWLENAEFNHLDEY